MARGKTFARADPVGYAPTAYSCCMVMLLLRQSAQNAMAGYQQTPSVPRRKKPLVSITKGIQFGRQHAEIKYARERP